MRVLSIMSLVLELNHFTPEGPIAAKPVIRSITDMCWCSSTISTLAKMSEMSLGLYSTEALLEYVLESASLILQAPAGTCT